MMWRLIALLLFASTAVAQGDSAAADQAGPPSMTFDVVSVRPVRIEPGHSYSGAGGFQPPNSSHLTMTTWNLFGILKTAFSLQQSYQIVAYDKLSPDILRLLYTIQARGDEDTDKRLAQLPEAQRQTEQQHMLQDLLIDRFQLKFHWEDRVVPGYRLLISKRGSKLLPAGSLPVDAASRSHDGTVRVLHQSRDDLGGTVYMGRGASLADLIP